MRVDEAGRPAASAGAARARRATPGFAVPDDAETPAAQASGEAEATASVAPILFGEIGMPAAEPPDDRQAAAHGNAMLEAMSGLQRALLEGGGAEACRRLADLARSRPSAADPGLESVLQSVALRAAVELARSE